ncbi:DUF3892 domain-containing protein [Neobacillus terrae]|uniref:DUF3892 domain-containing protein n=1 Tax=Neobacillus terrae TaxID=3034837 RepID=UPI001408E8A9|nr:DUF3892 domain-containing protein [Neobacillus terrae]NHM29205.1 hypothetical protein [Neobacillus terrae]
MEKIIALHRNYFGDIISFATSEGRIISYRKAMEDAKNGVFEGVESTVDSMGNLSLVPSADNSFDQLPEIY